MTEWTDIVELAVSQRSLSATLAEPAEPLVMVAKSPAADASLDLEAGIPTLEDLAQNYPAMFTWDQVKDQVDSG